MSRDGLFKSLMSFTDFVVVFQKWLFSVLAALAMLWVAFNAVRLYWVDFEVVRPFLGLGSVIALLGAMGFFGFRQADIFLKKARLELDRGSFTGITLIWAGVIMTLVGGLMRAALGRLDLLGL